jgi:hypothetical protein
MSKPAGVGGNEMEMDFLKMPAHLNGQMAIMMDSVFEVLESITNHFTNDLLSYGHSTKE